MDMMRSADAAGNVSEFSQSRTFTTLEEPDETPPEFDELPTVNVSGNTATITWLTNEETTGSVFYRQGDTTDNKDDNELKADHSIILTELSSGEYTYWVSIIDGSENGPVVSDEASFTISEPPPELQFTQWPTVTSVTRAVMPGIFKSSVLNSPSLRAKNSPKKTDPLAIKGMSQLIFPPAVSMLPSAYISLYPWHSWLPLLPPKHKRSHTPCKRHLWPQILSMTRR